MTLHVLKTKEINLGSLIVRDRYLEPSETAIKKMMASLEKHGQISSILVRSVTGNDYRLVTGATRFEAAKRLGWKTLRADFITVDHELRYSMLELSENLDRRDLTRAQKRVMKAKIVEYQKQLLEAVQPAIGGRGKKGGISDAARQAGMSPRTARRRRSKGGQDTENAQVSANAETKSQNGATPSGNTTSKLELKMAPCRLTAAELERFDAYWPSKGYPSRSECIRDLIREACK